MSAENNAGLARKLYDAFNRKDYDHCLALVTEDVEVAFGGPACADLASCTTTGCRPASIANLPTFSRPPFCGPAAAPAHRDSPRRDFVCPISLP